jgi:hypothetical protein
VAPNSVDQQEVKADLKLRLASAFLPNHSFRKLYGGLIADLMLSSRSGDPHADMLDKLLGTRGRAVRHRLTPVASMAETSGGRLQFLPREGK